MYIYIGTYIYIYVCMCVMRFDCGGDDVHHVNPCYDANSNKLQTPFPASFYRPSSLQPDEREANRKSRWTFCKYCRIQESGVRIQWLCPSIFVSIGKSDSRAHRSPASRVMGNLQVNSPIIIMQSTCLCRDAWYLPSFKAPFHCQDALDSSFSSFLPLPSSVSSFVEYLSRSRDGSCW